MMTHNLNKQNIFNFFKDKSFIEEFRDNKLLIEETKNEEKAENPLRDLTITSFNPTSKYWIVDTEANAFQLQGNKVEKIILEETEEGVLNIIMIEMKSKKPNQGKVTNKFKNSLSFVYLLLHLLEGKSNQKIKVFGILVAQKEIKWNEKSTLNIFSSIAISYTKRSFFTEESEMEILFDEVVAKV